MQNIPGNAHWLYKFVIEYRMGQKQILEYQIWLCKQLVSKLEQCNGDRDEFADATKQMCDWSSTICDYIFEELQCTQDAADQ